MSTSNKFAQALREQGLYPVEGIPFPVRAAPGQAVTQRQLNAATPQYGPHVDWLDMSKPEDRKKYEEVLDKAMNKAGVRLIGPPYKMPVPEKGTLMVLLVWSDAECVLPRAPVFPGT